MAKVLRNKLAMALCCTVVMGMPTQASTVLEAYEMVQEVEAIDRQETQVTTGGSITVELENSTGQESEDKWGTMVSEAQYLGDIKVLHATKDEASMAADFFDQAELPIEIRDGKVYLTLKISKDGLGVQNAITSLAQKQDGAYTELKLDGLDDDSIRYVTTEICIDNINESTTLKCGINTGFMQMAQELRIFLSEETISKLQAELDKEEAAVVADGTYLVNIDILKAGSDEPSHSASSFNTENTYLTIRDGKAYLTLIVKRDSGTFTDMIGGLEQIVNGENVPLSLVYTQVNGERVAMAEIALDALEAKTAIICHIQNPFTHSPELGVKLTEDSINALKQGSSEKITPVTISVAVGALGDSIIVNAAGGNGSYEYTIDGGTTWQAEATFTGLGAGTYKVVARDADHTSNISGINEVTLVQKIDSNTEELNDGSYSVNIEVLQETSDQASMAASFFNKERLPLEIINGKAYLTIQVLKDGMGMKDVITSLEQKIGGNFQELNLDYLDDSSKRYVTAEVVFDSVDDEAYLRCGIAPMGSMKPVLRIRLDKDSIKAGAGIIDTGLKAEATASISSVVAENGKVTITLTAADETLTAEDFAGKIYLNDSDAGKTLTLKDFKMSEETVTFTFDKVEQTKDSQNVKIGITLNGVETKSNEFVVKGSSVATEAIQKVTLKENAKEIKYISGYEDGTFRANKKVTNAEIITMLAGLVDVPAIHYYTAQIDVLQSEKDEDSMAKQFFKTEGIKIRKQADKYFVELEISNEGLGFTNIITKVEQKVDGVFKTIEVQKSSDLKKAYATLEVEDLSEAIVLKTGIAPMGSVAPELRIVINESSLKESAYESQFTDINMWAKEDIVLFESLGLIGGQGETAFNPNKAITRGEYLRLMTVVSGLEINEGSEHPFADSVGHVYEDYIVAAYQAGFIKGYEDGSFRPDQTLSRAEAVAMINRFIGHDETTHVDVENPFSDLIASHWAYQEIIKVVKA